MAPTLSVFGLTVQTYALTLVVAAEAGLWLSERAAQKLGWEGDRIHSLGFYALLATITGARLAYVIAHWDAYRGALLSILSPAPTALSWPEGLLTGGLFALIYGRRHRLPAGLTLDAIAPGLAAALALERLGAFLGGTGLGAPTTLPWGVYLWDKVRHPVQLYEMAALLSILGVLWWRQKRRPFAGHSFVLLVALYAGSRLFLEAYRAQTPLLPSGVRWVQPVALAITLGAVGYLYRRRFAAPETTSGSLKQETA